MGPIIKVIGLRIANIPNTKILVKAELTRWLKDSSELFRLQEVKVIIISGKLVPIEKTNKPIINLLTDNFSKSVKVTKIIQCEISIIAITPIIARNTSLKTFLFLTTTSPPISKGERLSR